MRNNVTNLKRIILSAAIFFVISSLMAPWYIDLIAVLLIIVISIYVKPSNVILILFSFVWSVMVIEVTVRYQDLLQPNDFRANERWATKERRYVPAVRDSTGILHGDLVALDSKADAIAQPRAQTFNTDSMGYRNDREYHHGDLVLVGDSFVAGVGSDQSDTISNVLSLELNRPAYNLGFPGPPSDYLIRAQDFISRTGNTSKFVLFVFEGNDFSSFNEYNEKTYGYQGKKLIFFQRLFSSLVYPRAMFYLVQRVPMYFSGPKVELYDINNETVGFFKDYIFSATDIKVFYDVAPHDLLMDKFSCIVFIPTKYRVYKPWLDDGRSLPEPAPAFEALRDYYEKSAATIIDLTPVFRRAAQTALTEEELLYWRDDTHWNGRGARVAARAVERCF